jgi:catechol 2,3-dioxygenase-like lactoylglutathione lyase family enzyme
VSVPARLSLVTLSTPDVERSAAFYERLGWRRSTASVAGEVAFFPLSPGTVLSLYARLARDTGVQAAPGACALALNCGSAGLVGEAVVAFVAAGGSVVRPPSLADWGGTTSTVADLDGHLWEVAHNPAWPLDERGALSLP